MITVYNFLLTCTENNAHVSFEGAAHNIGPNEAKGINNIFCNH